MNNQQWPSYPPSPGSGGYGSGGYGPSAFSGGGTFGYDSPGGSFRRPRRPRINPIGCILTLVILVVTLGGAAVAVLAVVKDIDIPGFGSVDALSADGLDQLREDVQEESGGTDVFRATIYPDYAVVDVPEDDSSKRQESFRWDGDLDSFGGKGTATAESRVDLADVKADVVLDAIATAKTLVEDPETWYIIIEGPNAFNEKQATMSAYASNDYSESAYVTVDLAGKEIRRYVDGEVIEAK